MTSEMPRRYGQTKTPESKGPRAVIDGSASRFGSLISVLPPARAQDRDQVEEAHRDDHREELPGVGHLQEPEHVGRQGPGRAECRGRLIGRRLPVLPSGQAKAPSQRDAHRQGDAAIERSVVARARDLSRQWPEPIARPGLARRSAGRQSPPRSWLESLSILLSQTAHWKSGRQSCRRRRGRICRSNGSAGPL